MSSAPVDLPVPTFKIDQAVVNRAGSIGGKYLQDIGMDEKPIGDLSSAQWQKFLMLIVGNAFLFAAEDYRNSEIPF
jgi:hypothetical protein